METILVDLYVPALMEHIDVLVPSFLRVQQLLPLLVEAVAAISDKQYISSGSELLCANEPQRLLMKEYTLEEYGICNGDYLTMI